jgi:hypothetical protein
MERPNPKTHAMTFSILFLSQRWRHTILLSSACPPKKRSTSYFISDPVILAALYVRKVEPEECCSCTATEIRVSIDAHCRRRTTSEKRAQASACIYMSSRPAHINRGLGGTSSSVSVSLMIDHTVQKPTTTTTDEKG